MHKKGQNAPDILSLQLFAEHVLTARKYVKLSRETELRLYLG